MGIKLISKPFTNTMNNWIWIDLEVQEGQVEEKLVCMGCKARLGYFNWAGMQCSCGAWINPAFQLQKSKLDECYM